MFEQDKSNANYFYQLPGYQKAFAHLLKHGKPLDYSDKGQDAGVAGGNHFLPINPKTTIDSYVNNGIMSVSEFHHKHPCANGGKSEVCGIINSEVRNNISEMAKNQVETDKETSLYPKWAKKQLTNYKTQYMMSDYLNKDIHPTREMESASYWADELRKKMKKINALENDRLKEVINSLSDKYYDENYTIEREKISQYGKGFWEKIDEINSLPYKHQKDALINSTLNWYDADKYVDTDNLIPPDEKTKKWAHERAEELRQEVREQKKYFESLPEWAREIAQRFAEMYDNSYKARENNPISRNFYDGQMGAARDKSDHFKHQMQEIEKMTLENQEHGKQMAWLVNMYYNSDGEQQEKFDEMIEELKKEHLDYMETSYLPTNEGQLYYDNSRQESRDYRRISLPSRSNVVRANTTGNSTAPVKIFNHQTQTLDDIADVEFKGEGAESGLYINMTDFQRIGGKTNWSRIEDGSIFTYDFWSPTGGKGGTNYKIAAIFDNDGGKATYKTIFKIDTKGRLQTAEPAAARHLNNGTFYLENGKVKGKVGTIAQLLGKLDGRNVIIDEQNNFENEFAYEWTGEYVTGEFKAKVVDIAKKLKIEPDILMGIMAFESGGINPKAVNPLSKATGLIQFMPSTAEKMGTSVEKLKSMSAVEQLDYVYKYYQPFAGKVHNIQDAYLVTLLPLAIGKDDNFVLGIKDSDEVFYYVGENRITYGLFYKQNQGLDINNDGIITKKEVGQKVINKINEYKRKTR
ncbi:MAG: lytic transglycosylase domain-containing protein [Firmicutes bacterium]|nr:lytic transglycosylase domain-containing protein [Bacillota bacterium]